MSIVAASVFREAVYDWLGSSRVIEHGDWQHRTTDGGWDAHGVMHHWTAMGRNVAIDRQVDILVNGRPDLPGPLCQIGTDWHGRVHLVGWRNCNHAGDGDSRVYNKLLAGRYDGSPQGSREDMGGNPYFYGIEHMYHPDDGVFPDAQFEAGVLVTCAIGQAHGWDHDALAGSTCEHYEFSRDKWDREVQDLAGRTRAAVRRGGDVATVHDIMHSKSVDDPRVTPAADGGDPSSDQMSLAEIIREIMLAVESLVDIIGEDKVPNLVNRKHGDGSNDVQYASWAWARAHLDAYEAKHAVRGLSPDVDEAKLAEALAPKLNTTEDTVKAALREVLRTGVGEQ